MDEMVLKAQKWVNATYGTQNGYFAGYAGCAEDGRTGWQTIYSLTRALQIELGITPTSDSFGPTTMARLTAYGPVGAPEPGLNLNIRTIAEAALYCKGYSGGEIDGTFGDTTRRGIEAMASDMGLGYQWGLVSPKVFKALLSMDAYVLTRNGKSSIQAAQRYLNRTYADRPPFAIGPCDGHFSRNVQKALVMALQYSLGMGDSVVTGTVGSGTRSALQARMPLSTISSDAGGRGMVHVFNLALVFNGYKGVVSDGWLGFGEDTERTTRVFQEFCHLPVTGKGDYQTWMSLLVSTGDPDRKGTAFDCKTPLNQARINTVKSAGYQAAGRYITGGTNKILTDSEIALILDNGLSFFPIYQEVANDGKYFEYGYGKAAGDEAHRVASGFGIPFGTVIYFAVDYDPLDAEISSAVVPYFQGVQDAIAAQGGKYAVGVYGTRNVCLRLSAAGLTTRSFVGGMSTGFSGNLGYRLPGDWAFDQIKNTTLGSGASVAEIDNDIASGRDLGVNSVTRPRDANDSFYTYLVWLEARAKQWRDRGNTQRSEAELVAQMLRNRIGDYAFPHSDLVFGDLDLDFKSFVLQYPALPDVAQLRDPNLFWDSDLEHFGASFGAVLKHGVPRPGDGPNLADFGSWAGDFLSLVGQFVNTGLWTDQAYDWALERCAATHNDTFFALPDLLADVDALNIGLACAADGSAKLSTEFKRHYGTAAAAKNRFAAFYERRFGGSVSETVRITHEAAMDVVLDVDYMTLRDGFWIKDFRTIGFPTPEHLPDMIVYDIGQAFAETLERLAQ